MLLLRARLPGLGGEACRGALRQAGRRRRPLSSSSATAAAPAGGGGGGGTRAGAAAAAAARPAAGGGGGGGGDGWSTKDKVGLVLFGSLVAGTTGLGFWQAQRYFWKLEQIEQRQASLAKEAVPLVSQDLHAPEPHRPYTLTGTFLHDRELRVGPRSAPKSIHGPAQGLGTNPQGYYILTPLKTKDDGRVVIVNRGWAPLKADVARPNGTVTLRGVVAEGEKPGTFAPPNDFAKGTILWVDLPAIERWMTTGRPPSPAPAAGGARDGLMGTDGEAPPAPYFLELVDEDDDKARLQWPVARAASDVGDFYVMPITHLVYSATWFSLAAFGAVASRRILRPR